ncbi:MAG: OmpH family outer membrane protein [Winogradskyella sp.]|nr:MAG: OmpH family outer membrane protein [Winogradskyella sp.]
MKLKLLTLLALFLFSFNAIAQSYKIGYVDVEKILSEWPASKEADTELQKYQVELNEKLQAKVKDFQTKLTNYNENKLSMSVNVQRDTESQLYILQLDIEEFKVSAEQLISEKNLKLLLTLEEKLNNTITAFGKENAYTHIFAQNSVLFTTETETSNSDDISSKVAQKLGFTLSK